MDDGRPAADEVYKHYRRLVGEPVPPALDVALCWTVVVPNVGAAPLTVEDIGTRLSGGTGHEVHEAAGLDVVDLPDYRLNPPPVAVDRAGSAIVLYGLDYLGVPPAVTRPLSTNARVYNAWWNVNSVNYLSLAVDGEVLLSIDGLFPGRPEDHPNLAWWPELTAISGFFLDYEDTAWTGRDDNWDWRAGFLTGIELATGVRLDRRWLNAEHPYLTCSGPVTH
ncbi:DUF6461 domain-containing protein [Streptosporangium sp. NPDC005286]|uniref:DUF6461 domain-containing protein n=1 Tax=Streptosporangium sp. NPDC005286 TaxID=3154463 RepID=UPI0033A22C54